MPQVTVFVVVVVVVSLIIYSVATVSQPIVVVASKSGSRIISVALKLPCAIFYIFQVEFL